LGVGQIKHTCSAESTFLPRNFGVLEFQCHAPSILTSDPISLKLV
jgi:hypothetical protein